MSQTWLAIGSSTVPTSARSRSRLQKLGKLGRLVRPDGRSQSHEFSNPRKERLIGIMPTGFPLRIASESIETLSAVT